ncbi:MAG: hypothetical protein ACFCUQ_20430 [Kiloniellales bacterium]
MRKDMTFEETYPQQPFSVLIRLSLWLGAAIRRQLDRGQVSPKVPARA